MLVYIAVALSLLVLGFKVYSKDTLNPVETVGRQVIYKDFLNKSIVVNMEDIVNGNYSRCVITFTDNGPQSLICLIPTIYTNERIRQCMTYITDDDEKVLVIRLKSKTLFLTRSPSMGLFTVDRIIRTNNEEHLDSVGLFKLLRNMEN